MDNIARIMASITKPSPSGKLDELHKITQGGVKGSESLEIRGSDYEGGGRGMFSLRKLSAGSEVLRVDKPEFYVTSKGVCDGCLHNEHSSITKLGHINAVGVVDENKKNTACSGCKKVSYCSKECQKSAWKHHHKVECAKLQDLGDIYLMPQLHLTIRIILLRMNGRISDEMWTVILSLESQYETQTQAYWPEDDAVTPEMLKSITGCLMSQAEIDALSCRILLNCFNLMTVEDHHIATMLNPFTSFINHSCAPSLHYFWNGNSFCMRSSRDIEENGELTISYIQLSLDFNFRQAKLKTDYGFNCGCSRCKKDFQDLSGNKASKLMKFAATEGVDLIQLEMLDTAGRFLIQTEGSLQEKINKMARQLTSMANNAVPGADWPECLEPIPSFHVELTGIYTMVGMSIEAFQNALRTCFVHDRKLFKQPVDNRKCMHLLTLQMTFNGMMASLQSRAGYLNPNSRLLALGELKEELRTMSAHRHLILIETGRKVWGRDCVVVRALERLFEQQQGRSFDEVSHIFDSESAEIKRIRIAKVAEAEVKILKWAKLVNPMKRSFFLAEV